MDKELLLQSIKLRADEVIKANGMNDSSDPQTELMAQWIKGIYEDVAMIIEQA